MPVSQLVMEQCSLTAEFFKNNIGHYAWGIATYVLAATAMIVGSMLKPKTKITQTETQ